MPVRHVGGVSSAGVTEPRHMSPAATLDPLGVRVPMDTPSPAALHPLDGRDRVRSSATPWPACYTADIPAPMIAPRTRSSAFLVGGPVRPTPAVASRSLAEVASGHGVVDASLVTQRLAMVVLSLTVLVLVVVVLVVLVLKISHAV